ncbi:hypothetical protein Pmani_026312 [Petrolisthes manimaculis]|uniref:Uncharacterized protein n=1 Tax=Petrolisthes manimaculis TaxID=1843537 RepID=A0AAE1U073_9EUCA|nr:hypothetical protein Pmani_026312 [Petrolisthes manimaculis]
MLTSMTLVFEAVVSGTVLLLPILLGHKWVTSAIPNRKDTDGSYWWQRPCGHLLRPLSSSPTPAPPVEDAQLTRVT